MVLLAPGGGVGSPEMLSASCPTTENKGAPALQIDLFWTFYVSGIV